MIDFTAETKLSENQIHDLFSVEGAIFCDIGARIGEFSIPRANLCKEVYAFEPSPFNFPTLQDRAKQFGDKYKCFNVAFSDKEYDCVTPFKDCTNESEQEIKYRIMEKFFADNNLDTPTFVKIDVEGMESQILKTMDFLFEKKVPIYTEIHYNNDSWGATHDFPDNPSFKSLNEGGFDFNKLKEYGYKVYNNIHQYSPTPMTFLTEDADYNPPHPTHGGMLIVP